MFTLADGVMDWSALPRCRFIGRFALGSNASR